MSAEARRRGVPSLATAPTAVLVALTLGAGSVVAVARDALAAGRFGATSDGDAYFFGTALAVLLVTILVSESTAQAVVVQLSAGSQAGAPPRFPLRLLAVAGLGLAAVSLLAALGAPLLVRAIAPGFEGAEADVAARATAAAAPTILLLGLAWLVAAWLNAAGRFVVPALLTPLVAAGACVPLLLGTTSPAIAALGWAGGAGLALLVLLALGRRATRYAGPPAQTDGAPLRAVVLLALPLLLMVGVQGSVEVVDRALASQVGAGGVTTIALAKKALHLPGTVLLAAVGAVTLPYLARRTGAREQSSGVAETVNLALFFLLPVAALLYMLRLEITDLLFGRGAYAGADVRATAELLGLYGLVLVPVNLGGILQRSCVAVGAGRAAMLPYAVALGCYGIAAWAGTGVWGLRALPVAFGVAEAGYVVALLVLLHRKLQLDWRRQVRPTGAAVAGTAAVVLAVALTQALLPAMDTTRIIVGSLAGIMVYALTVVALGHPAARELLAVARPSRRAPSEPRRLRVALDVTYAEGYGGTSRYVTSLARELERGAVVEVVRCRSPRVNRLPRPLRVVVNGVLHVGWSQVGLPLFAWRQRIDVIHGTMTGPVHAPCPVVVTVHDGLDFHPDVRPSRVWSAYMRTLGALTARRAGAVLTGTRASAEEIARFYRVRHERLHVVPYGNGLAGVTARPMAGFEPPACFALIVGAAERRKNVETAVAAVEQARRAGWEVELVLVGSVPSALADGRPWLRQLRAVDDAELAWLYERAAVVVVPSRHEGFGLPVVEALARGAPVVASRIPALLEVGEGGRFADPEDTAGFARELVAVLADPNAERDRIAPAVERARALTWQATATGTIVIYTALVRERERSQAWLPTAAS